MKFLRDIIAKIKTRKYNKLRDEWRTSGYYYKGKRFRTFKDMNDTADADEQAERDKKLRSPADYYRGGKRKGFKVIPGGKK